MSWIQNHKDCEGEYNNMTNTNAIRCTFLGTGTSMGVPVAGGFGRNWVSKDPRNERWRCSAWIQSEDTSVIIDAGPEFRLQTIRAGVEWIDLVLITHEHMDHIAGLDDLRAYNYKQQFPIPLFTNEESAMAIRHRFDYMFEPVKYPGSTSLDIEIIDKTRTFRDLTITPLPCTHGNVDVQGYRINQLSYLTDVKSIPESTKERIRGSSVMVLSGLRWSPSHPTHLTIPEAVEIAEELEIPMTYLIHMNSYVDHGKSQKKLPPHVRLAYDMQEITIP